MLYTVTVSFDHNTTEYVDTISCVKWLKEHGQFVTAVAALKAFRELQASTENLYVFDSYELLSPPHGLILWSEKYESEHDKYVRARRAEYEAQQALLERGIAGDPVAAIEFCRNFNPSHYACSGGYA